MQDKTEQQTQTKGTHDKDIVERVKDILDKSEDNSNSEGEQT